MRNSHLHTYTQSTSLPSITMPPYYKSEYKLLPRSLTDFHKGLPLTACAFSHDGSLLAVAAGSKLTLWEPQHSSWVCTLPSPPELAGGYVCVCMCSCMRVFFLCGCAWLCERRCVPIVYIIILFPHTDQANYLQEPWHRSWVYTQQPFFF